jgi:flagellar biosynthesis protein FlhG
MYWGDKIVIAVGGGKGGIGKSTFSANLGVSMAARGKRVVVIDADLGAANLHTILGVRYPEKTLDDFLSNRNANLESTLVDTAYANLRLLSSASDVLSLASPSYSERQRLFRAIQKLNVDVIIFDIAAGSQQRATDFFSLAPIGIILVEPVPTSLENAFSFLKNLLVRGLLRRFYHDKEITTFIQNTVDPRSSEQILHFSDLLVKLEEKAPAKVGAYRQLFLEGVCKMYVVVNSVKNKSQIPVAEKFCRIIKRYLALNMEVLGVLPYEQAMDDSVINRTPFVVKYPDSPYAKGVADIVAGINAIKPQTAETAAASE